MPRPKPFAFPSCATSIFESGVLPFLAPRIFTPWPKELGPRYLHQRSRRTLRQRRSLLGPQEPPEIVQEQNEKLGVAMDGLNLEDKDEVELSKLPDTTRKPQYCESFKQLKEGDSQSHMGNSAEGGETSTRFGIDTVTWSGLDGYDSQDRHVSDEFKKRYEEIWGAEEEKECDTEGTKTDEPQYRGKRRVILGRYHGPDALRHKKLAEDQSKLVGDQSLPNGEPAPKHYKRKRPWVGNGWRTLDGLDLRPVDSQIVHESFKFLRPTFFRDRRKVELERPGESRIVPETFYYLRPTFLKDRPKEAAQGKVEGNRQISTSNGSLRPMFSKDRSPGTLQGNSSVRPWRTQQQTRSFRSFSCTAFCRQRKLREYKNKTFHIRRKHELKEKWKKLSQEMEAADGPQLSQMYDELEASGTAIHYFGRMRFVHFLARKGETQTAIKALATLHEQGADFSNPLVIQLCCTLLQNRFRKELATPTDFEMFDWMTSCGLKPACIIYNILIMNTLQRGDTESAEEIYAEMKEKGIEPDEFTFSILLNSAKKRGDWKSVKGIFQVASPKFGRFQYLLADILHSIFLVNEESRRRFWGLQRLRATALKPMFRFYSQYFNTQPFLDLIPPGRVPGQLHHLFHRSLWTEKWFESLNAEWSQESQPTEITGIDSTKISEDRRTESSAADPIDSSEGQQLEPLATNLTNPSEDQRPEPSETVPTESSEKQQIESCEDSPTGSSDSKLMEPDGVILHIMLLALLKSRHKPEEVLEYSRHFQKLVQENHPSVRQLADNTRTYDIYLFALGRWEENLGACAELLKFMMSPPPPDPETQPSPTPQRPSLQPSVYSWSILLKSFMSHYQSRAAEKVLQMMEDRGVQPVDMTWHSLIGGYAKMQDIQGALDAWDRMVDSGWAATSETESQLHFIRNRDALNRMIMARVKAQEEEGSEGEGEVESGEHEQSCVRDFGGYDANEELAVHEANGRWEEGRPTEQSQDQDLGVYDANEEGTEHGEYGRWEERPPSEQPRANSGSNVA